MMKGIEGLEKLKYELGLRHSVRISSPKYGEEKAKSLQSADLFVLPSHSENFGIVVAEALGYGVPVITTTGCPWEDLVKYKCGWWVNADISDFKQALSLALRLPKSKELRNLGANGRQLVKSKYQWKAIAEQMLAFYQYLLKEGPNQNLYMKQLDIAQNRSVKNYSCKEIVLRILWGLGKIIFKSTPRIAFPFRNSILRLFGAKIGKLVSIFITTAVITYPWNLKIDEFSAIGESALIYNLGSVEIGKRSTISQNSHLCAGTHDYADHSIAIN